MARYVFITGGVVSSLGKGIASAALGAMLAGARLQGPPEQARSLSQCRSGHDEPVSARRGVRHRRRRRDRSRPRPLRALHRAPGLQGGLRHHRPHLPGDHRPASARGDYLGATVQVIPHVTDAIKAFVLSGNERCRLRAVRDRRHGRRHRGDAVPGGDPPDRQRPAARRRRLYPPDAAALHPVAPASSRPSRPSIRSRNCARSASSPTSCSAAADRPIPKEERRKLSLFCNVREQRRDPGARRRPYLRRADRLSCRRARRRGARRLRHRPARRRRAFASWQGASTSASAIRKAR